MVYGGCTEGVWRVYGECLYDSQRVSGWYLEGVYKQAELGVPHSEIQVELD